MDYKRNARYFNEKTVRNMNILLICGIAVVLISAAIWWYLWSSIVMEIAMVLGVAMVIGSLTMRPKTGDLFAQVEAARKEFNDSAADKLKFPSDFEENTLSIWGYLDGSAEKKLKGGARVTDRIQFSLLYLKKSTLYVRTESLLLTEEGRSVNEYQLPLSELNVSVEGNALQLATAAESLSLPIQAVDYPLEEFLGKLEHQIKKAS